ncbi:type II toxin-antitoxin system HicB family antitoxin [Patescibacteria group bacterium]|nr:type II toxin-antitoxin system HicB family antitoxin [Candidatus Falkowbacteria bacterium]MBU3906054.1 type II toxin-antitoxin system HicB family antitoxin [Patescibacteria group bacterium]MBU4015083.1 type II toxin-antitoxin system HicB family antitoxin [Patescibacteria group bacterium]MBU4026199.1 type II toxin-antitoxin system HicB family antitoxin [Patescibacteria group bacterium]MBU4073703.1 type II toxin-antitoxin system HicB family antitoxin [Patescibacteria group bacterium]
MLIQFIEKNLFKAKYKTLDDGSYFGEIPGFKGVWANNKNLEKCREELKEVLEEWLILKIRDDDKIPKLLFNFNNLKVETKYAC